jgi:hypothetical protein
MTVDGTSFRVEVPKVPHFKITKNGVEITLEQDEMLQLLSNREVRDLFMHMHTYDENQNLTINEDVRLIIRKVNDNRVPPNYTKILEAESDPKSPHHTIFVYYQNVETGDYAFTTINKTNKSPHHFSRLGRIEDPTSLIGAFIRDFVKWVSSTDFQRPLIKHEISKKSIGGKKPDGSKLKALLDILKHQGYLKTQPVLEKRGKPGYTWTGKTDGLGDVLAKYELQKAHSSHLLTTSQ